MKDGPVRLLVGKLGTRLIDNVGEPRAQANRSSAIETSRGAPRIAYGTRSRIGSVGRSPCALPVIGARGSFDGPASITKSWSSEYQVTGHVRGRRRTLVLHEISDQVARDAELHIAVDVLVVRDIDLRDQCLESVF